MLAKIFLILLLVLLISGSYFYFSVLPRLGAAPSGKSLEEISQSANYSHTKKSFINQDDDEVLKSQRKTTNNIWKILKQYFTSTEMLVPKHKLPEVTPDLAGLIESSSDANIKFIWLGHSSLLVRMGGKTLLLDPVLSSFASPINFINRRFQPPVLIPKQLPKIDFIVISHDHYDHLDQETVSYFAGTDTKFFVPLGLTSHLRKWGIQAEHITELDWWQHTKLADSEIELICTPAQHFSGRALSDKNATLWASWIVRTKTKSLYYSGDTGYSKHFKQIGDKYGPFDVSFIENGQYNKFWRKVHMLPAESAQAYFDLNSKTYVPVHWGMFNMSTHSWSDPIVQISALADELGINLVTPKLGELVTIPHNLPTQKWW